MMTKRYSIEQGCGQIHDVTGIILAGGIGRRIGGDKGTITLDGKPLLHWVIEAIQPLFPQVMIVQREDQDFYFPGVSTVCDDPQYPEGALRGILAGLQAIDTEGAFVCGCDMPFIQGSVVREMYQSFAGVSGVLPKLKDGFHPLHALYRKNLISRIEEKLQEGSMRIRPVFQKGQLAIVNFYQCPEKELSFFNINTRNHLQKAREYVEAGVLPCY